ncbi:MAG: hypothetical protein EBZ62_05925, partial [Sphingobacteriia bacterium]|nr:hypothetical protein [Sphingobacteriia bacterium]
MTNCVSVPGVGKQIRFVWSDLNPITISGQLFVLKFRILSGGYHVVDWDLTPGLCEYANQFGQVISNSTWSFGTISCNSNPINVSLGSISGCSGDTLSIPVAILNANNIGAISLALNYSPNSTTFLDVTGIDPVISTLIASTNNFGGFNQIRASWAEVTPVNLDGIAFYIRVIVNNTDNLSFDITNTGNTEISDPLGNPYNNVTYSGTNTSVTASTTNTTNATACSNYTWSVNNQSYSTSGTYTIKSGCHLEILNLTISAQPPAPTGLACYETATFNTTTCSWVISGTPSPTIVTNISACNSFLWPINGLTYSSGGVYNFSQNCQDYRLILTINPSYNINVTLPLFFGSTFNFNGQTITSAGTYSSTFQSIYGCDSVVNLTLVSSTTAISVGNASVSCPGDVVTVPVLISGVSNLAAISLALNYNTQALSYVSYSGLNPAIANNFLINNVN